MRRVDEQGKPGRADGMEIPMDHPAVSEPKTEDGHPTACIPRISQSLLIPQFRRLSSI